MLETHKKNLYIYIYLYMLYTMNVMQHDRELI